VMVQDTGKRPAVPVKEETIDRGFHSFVILPVQVRGEVVATLA